MELSWVVYVESNGKIKPYDIFQHKAFTNEVEWLLRHHDKKSEFVVELKGALAYYFRKKNEWEVKVVGCHDKNISLKTDAFQQVLNNWDAFVVFCWGQRQYYLPGRYKRKSRVD